MSPEAFRRRLARGNKHESLREIGKRYGVTKQTVYSWVHCRRNPGKAMLILADIYCRGRIDLTKPFERLPGPPSHAMLFPALLCSGN